MKMRKSTAAAALLLAAVLLAGCAQSGAQIVVQDGGGRAKAGAGEYGNGENSGETAQETEIMTPDCMEAAPGYDREPEETAPSAEETKALPGADPGTSPSLPDKTLPDGATIGPPVLPSSGSGLVQAGQILRVEDLEPAVTYVNWSEDGGAAFMTWALEFTEGRVAALEDRKTLDSFLHDMGRYFSLGSDGNGFRGLAEAWDDAFFEEKVLLVVYLPSGSGSNRFLLKSAEIWESKLSLQVECQYPEIGTCDMAGWFLSVEIPRKVWNQVSYVGMDVNAVRMSGDR